MEKANSSQSVLFMNNGAVFSLSEKEFLNKFPIFFTQETIRMAISNYEEKTYHVPLINVLSVKEDENPTLVFGDNVCTFLHSNTSSLFIRCFNKNDPFNELFEKSRCEIIIGDNTRWSQPFVLGENVYPNLCIPFEFLYYQPIRIYINGINRSVLEKVNLADIYFQVTHRTFTFYSDYHQFHNRDTSCILLIEKKLVSMMNTQMIEKQRMDNKKSEKSDMSFLNFVGESKSFDNDSIRGFYIDRVMDDSIKSKEANFDDENAIIDPAASLLLLSSTTRQENSKKTNTPYDLIFDRSATPVYKPRLNYHTEEKHRYVFYSDPIPRNCDALANLRFLCPAKLDPSKVEVRLLRGPSSWPLSFRLVNEKMGMYGIHSESNLHLISVVNTQAYPLRFSFAIDKDNIDPNEIYQSFVDFYFVYFEQNLRRYACRSFNPFIDVVEMKKLLN